jgi:probable HAF family extracellular repeat protein
MKFYWISLLLAAASLLAGLNSAQAQPKFLVTDIGANTFAGGINGRGDVAGTLSVPGTASLAFFYKEGKIHTFGNPAGYFSSGATGINDSDELIGSSGVTPPTSHSAPKRSAFLYDRKGARINIDTTETPIYPDAAAINDPGTVVGWFDAGTTGPLQHAFIFRNGQIQDIGSLLGVGFNGALSINDAGQIVGELNNGKGGFLYSNGRVQILGFLPSHINDHGQIVGENSPYATNPTAVLYEGGVLRPLGTLSGFTDSDAIAINNGGEIIGVCESSTAQSFFLYFGGQMYDLNKLVRGNWVLTGVSGINDFGQIAATGALPNSSVPHALLLNPTWSLGEILK